MCICGLIHAEGDEALLLVALTACFLAAGFSRPGAILVSFKGGSHDECWLLIEVLKVRSKGRGTGGALSIGHPGGPVNPFSGGGR